MNNITYFRIILSNDLYNAINSSNEIYKYGTYYILYNVNMYYIYLYINILSTFIYIHIHTHTHTHTYIYIYIYIYIYLCLFSILKSGQVF